MTQKSCVFKHRMLRRLCFLAVVSMVILLGLNASAAAAKTVRLNKSAVLLEEKKTCKLQLTGAQGTIRWKTTDKAVATVSSAGKVTAKKAGTCRVYATYKGKKYICQVTVAPKAALNKYSAVLLKGGHCQLKLENAIDVVTWSSSDKTVASVNQTGKVTAKKAGTCKIYATYNKTNYACTVNVYNSNAEWMPDMLTNKYKVSANKGKVILAGSSLFDYWNGASGAFAPLEIVNMGIAGSRVSDWIELYPRLIAKYKPKAVVLYIGGNDIRTGTTGKQTAVKIRTLLTKMQKDMPDTKIYYISINPSVKCWDVWDEMKICNSYVQKFCSARENLYYIRTSRYFLGKDGLPRADYLRADGLHPNAAGYKVLKKHVAGKVKNDLL